MLSSLILALRAGATGIFQPVPRLVHRQGLCIIETSAPRVNCSAYALTARFSLIACHTIGKTDSKTMPMTTLLRLRSMTGTLPRK